MVRPEPLASLGCGRLNQDPGLIERLRYAALRMPLAMLELPLYVLLPKLFAALLPLSLVGLTLLLARLVDALADPWLGAQWDRAVARDAHQVQRMAWRVLLCAGLVYLSGFNLLLWWAELAEAHQQAPIMALGVLAAGSCITYLAYSLSTIVYQSWGTALAGSEAGRSRLALTREGLGLAGVIVMSAFLQLESVEEKGLVSVLLALVSAVALWMLRPVAYPSGAQGTGEGGKASTSNPGAHWGFRSLLQTPPMRALFGCFMLSAIAAAIPATLVLFFIAEVLRLPDASPLFLIAYFLSAAIGLPLWTRISDRLGQSASWACAMTLAIAAFVFCLQLGEGDGVAYAAVCVVTGFALGADLAMPLAILARLIRAHDAKHSSAPSIAGRCMGYWTLVGKLNLAIAAGLALPLLELFGGPPSTPASAGLKPSSPGGDAQASLEGDPGSLFPRLIEQLSSASLPTASAATGNYDPAVLGLIYAGLPCLLKTASLLFLLRSRQLYKL